jgi:hypothetical protein
MNQPNLLKEAYDYGFKLALAEAGLFDKTSGVWQPLLNLFGTASGKSRNASQLLTKTKPKPNAFKKFQAGEKATSNPVLYGQRNVHGQLAFNV